MRFKPASLLAAQPFNNPLVPHFFLESKEISLKVCSTLPNSPSGSFCRLEVPLKQQRVLQKLRWGSDKIRIGRVLQILDTMAGLVGYRHCHGFSNIFMATVLVDNFAILQEIRPTDSLRVDAYVQYVGKSTIEVVTEITQQEILKAKANFLMACRNSLNFTAVQVPPLALEGELSESHCQQRFDAAKKHQQVRRKKQISSQVPSGEQLAIMHKAIVERKQSAKRVQDTEVRSTMLLHQDTKNLHGKVFGGLLMRLAVQAMYISAKKLYDGGNFLICFIDDVLFLRPVEIGSAVDIRTQVCFAEGAIVVVHAEIWCREFGGKDYLCTEMTCCLREEKGGQSVRPVTYEQGLRYIRGLQLAKSLG